MKEELLVRLSNADAVASKEGEVRAILKEELSAYSDEIMYDTLGSISFHKKGTAEKPLKIMFCAHMDEVGFLVRHISDIGFVYLIALGGVQQKSMEMQKVRITTASGSKVSGILNITTDENHHVRELYVDLGCDNREEVAALGVEIGNMVCFDSNAHPFNQDHVYAGKAMDDRSGCYVLAQAMKRLHELSLENEIILCATSSEEVGVRGGKTAVYKEEPDLVFALDVANHPELSRNYTNHRRLGKGCMLVHYDKTLAPNEKLLAFVKEIAQTHDIPYQCDMFSGGGTDAGNAGISRSGTLAMVIGIPLRYCHGSWSLVDTRDLDHTIELVVQLAKALTKERMEAFTAY